MRTECDFFTSSQLGQFVFFIFFPLLLRLKTTATLFLEKATFKNSKFQSMLSFVCIVTMNQIMHPVVNSMRHTKEVRDGWRAESKPHRLSLVILGS